LSTVDAVNNDYQNGLLVCGLIALVIFVGSYFVRWGRRPIGWKWGLFGSCVFLLLGGLTVHSDTVDNFVEARVEEDSITLTFAQSETPVVLGREQILDVAVGFVGKKNRQSCYLIVAPKEGWHYRSVVISNDCADCEKYRDRIIAKLKLPGILKGQGSK